MVILLAGLRNEFVGMQISNKYATYKQNREIYLRGVIQAKKLALCLFFH